MINHILLVCSSVLIYEFIRYIRFSDILKSNLKIYQKILKLFKYKNVSDFRKEKLIFNYSKSLFIVSIKIVAILISIFGIIELTLVVIIYHQLRKKINAKL